ncbi:MAG: endoribonuclease MazF [Acidobacteriota bacterium]|nr:MAG: endoribonuclease MazF [Acidobacteriota bacterium]
MATRYAPDRGEIVWLHFDPQAGHEQSGRRPAIVVSPAAYNRKVGLGLFCPITNRVKGYPYEVLLPDGLDVSGAVLSDQIKSLDWKARKATRICVAPTEITEDVLAKLNTLVS